ncbi:MAG TPA: hypothetical protein VFE11_03840, partial [Dongiaceae bacterium]|nr:hypothetical protein [Dongiaceae bacterium]
MLRSVTRSAGLVFAIALAVAFGLTGAAHAQSCTIAGGTVTQTTGACTVPAGSTLGGPTGLNA